MKIRHFIDFDKVSHIKLINNNTEVMEGHHSLFACAKLKELEKIMYMLKYLTTNVNESSMDIWKKLKKKLYNKSSVNR